MKTSPLERKHIRVSDFGQLSTVSSGFGWLRAASGGFGCFRVTSGHMFSMRSFDQLDTMLPVWAIFR